MREKMRGAIAALILLAALPLVAAQAEPAASLTLDPPIVRAPANGHATTFVILDNPTNAPTRWHLSAESLTGVNVTFDRVQVGVPAGGREQVHLVARVPDANNVTHTVTIRAQEASSVTSADAANAGGELKAELTIRVGPPPETTPPARPPPRLDLKLDPPAIDVPAGETRETALIVRNVGDQRAPLSLVADGAPGVRVQLRGAPPGLAAGEEARVAVVVTTAPDARAGPRDVQIGAENADVRAVNLVVRVAPPPARPGEPVTDTISPPVADPQPTDDLPTDTTAPPTVEPAEEPIDPRVLAGVGVAAVAGAWTSLWLTRRHWWPLLLALYTRLRPSKLLDHPVRRKIVEVVRAEPGITFGELARRVGIAPGQLTHHARMLEKAGIVFSSPDGQTRRFFHVAEGRMKPVPPLAERALAAVRARPMRLSELAKELGASRQSVHYHVKSLVKDGKLVARADGVLEAVGVGPATAARDAART